VAHYFNLIGFTPHLQFPGGNEELSACNCAKRLSRREGQLSEQNANSIVANAKKTALQARFERLPMKNALQVYDVATSKEKAELTPALMKKRAAFLRDMYKTHSYQEIQTDPMIRRLMSFVPQQ
jgi:hypothetical protein